MEEESTEIHDQKYFEWKAERQQRLRIVSSVVPALFGFVILFYLSLDSDYKEFPFPLSRSLLSILGPLFILISGLSILMAYLQTGFKKASSTNTDYLKHENELRRLRDRIESHPLLDNDDLENIKTELALLKEQAEKNTSINEAITSGHKDELVQLLKNEILIESKSQASVEILNKIEDKVKNINQASEVENVFLRTLDRLNSEVNALSRRGNLNLSLGILTTIIGLAILGYFVLEIDSIPEDKMAFIAHFIPRLSLVVLIEVFAYFFLKLYKSSLSEIKYFQNEMTNAESKLIAIKCSIMTADSATTSIVIKNLSETERNAILEKGQTTAEIEKSKIEQQNISTISERVSSFLKPIKDT